MWICGSVGEDELQLPVILVWVRDPLLEREVFLFADSEIVSDGIERRNCSQRSAAGVYQVPYLCLRNTGDAVNRGNNACETEVDTGGFDCGFADLDLSLRSSNGSFCGLHLVFVGEVRLVCIVEVLFADRIDLCQRSVLVYIELAHLLVRLGCSELRLVLNQLRLCLSQLRLCLVKRRLEWSRIDLEEELSLPDVGSFLIFPSEQIAGDLRFYVCIHLPGESPDPFSINGNVSLLDGCDLHNGQWGLHRGLGP